MTGLRVADFDYELPEDLIAQHSPAVRGSSRMLVLNRATQAGAREPGTLDDCSFQEFPSLLQPGDLLVLNDSRVIPARLFARRSNARGEQQPSGLIEVLLTAPSVSNGHRNWWSLVRPGRKVRAGDSLEFTSASGEVVLNAEVLEQGQFGARLLRFAPVDDFFATLEAIGHVPLPPYIKRKQPQPDDVADRERYQTVFAAHRGSVAAPTAGLHFTPEVLEAIAARGVEIAKITLHVGLGTFAPLRAERVDEVHLHSERYTLPAATASELNKARSEGRRIVAVGTTVVRTLEHCALAAESNGGQLAAHSGETSIFISPGFKFRLVGAMLTNFHLPQSSLLMLVSAFAGRERVLAAYSHAVREAYRFFSYGDCMFLS